MTNDCVIDIAISAASKSAIDACAALGVSHAIHGYRFDFEARIEAGLFSMTCASVDRDDEGLCGVSQILPMQLEEGNEINHARRRGSEFALSCVDSMRGRIEGDYGC